MKIDDKHYTDESLSNYLLKMMKVYRIDELIKILVQIHNRLTECVKCLDRMFNVYFIIFIPYLFDDISNISKLIIAIHLRDDDNYNSRNDFLHFHSLSTSIEGFLGRNRIH